MPGSKLKALIDMVNYDRNYSNVLHARKSTKVM
jgi:hypothetical protein